MIKRQWLYHKTFGGKIFNSFESIEAALADGWAETPVGEDENLGQQTPITDDKKQDAPESQQTSGEDEAGKPIKKDNYIKWNVKKLKEFLVSKGAKESELKGLEKDELIAKIGELGK